MLVLDREAQEPPPARADLVALRLRRPCDEALAASEELADHGIVAEAPPRLVEPERDPTSDVDTALRAKARAKAAARAPQPEPTPLRPAPARVTPPRAPTGPSVGAKLGHCPHTAGHTRGSSRRSGIQAVTTSGPRVGPLSGSAAMLGL
jgi:hypothetical protein